MRSVSLLDFKTAFFKAKSNSSTDISHDNVNGTFVNDDIRMYWHGDWQDLCRGPHFQNTAQVPADAFKLMSVAGA